MKLLAALSQPDIFIAVVRAFADVGLGYAVWYFDMLVAFLLAFAAAYGVFVVAERVFPPAAGARPRVWLVPLLFLAVAAGFPLFFDRFVSTFAVFLRERCGLTPASWLVGGLACVWLAGVVFKLAGLARGAVLLARCAGRLPVYSASSAEAAAIRAAGLGNAVTVLTGAPGTPVVSFGIVRARILVPEDFCDRYAPDERYAILLHECVHIRYRDALKRFCLSLADAVLWFDPVTRHALRRVKADMEILCDWTLVNAHRVAPAAYASLIVRAAAEGHGLAPGFSDSYLMIARRLGHILGDGAALFPSSVSRKRAVCALAFLAGLLVAGAAAYARLPSLPLQSPPADAATSLSERHGVFSSYAIMWSTFAGESGDQ